ncbi:hypothetical protein Q3G72_027531 [Acer saccharum]|nr:hypothetical protein Q3G72_027531 [Acer saccharum]
MGGKSYVTVVKDKVKVSDTTITKSGHAEETIDWDESYSDNRWLELSAVGVLKGRILVLILFNHPCPKTIKVLTKSKSFTVQVIEEPTPVGYSDILDLLGLNWEDDDVDEMQDDHRKRKEDEGTEVMWTNHRKSDLLTGDRPRSNHCNDKECRSGVETLVDNCLGKGTNTDGVDRSIKGKGIDKEKVSGKQSLFETRTAATYGVLDVGDKRNDDGFDSSDDSEEGYVRNYDICGGTSIGRLGQFDQ